MYNLSKLLILCVAFVDYFAASGCYSSHGMSDNSELLIESGVSYTSVSLPAGAAGAEVMSFLITSNSTRPIAAVGVQCDAHGVLADDLNGDIVSVRLVRDDGSGVGGTFRFGPGYENRIFFDAPVVVQPGESVELKLVIDTTATASNRVTFYMGQYIPWQPSASGASLFTSIVYADNGETVPSALVQGNEVIEEHVVIGGE